MRSGPSPASITAAAGRGLPVWLPWVLAPGFLLLPVGGCAAAAALRWPQPATLAAAPPGTGPRATVATVMPTDRAVAWPPMAN